MNTQTKIEEPKSAEPYFTIPQTADLLSIPVSTLRRAVNSGAVPYHRPFSNRIRLRISEVIAAIEARQMGGRGDE